MLFSFEADERGSNTLSSPELFKTRLDAEDGALLFGVGLDDLRLPVDDVFGSVIFRPGLLGVKYFGGDPSRELVLDRDDLKLDRRLVTGNDDDDLGVAGIGVLSSFKSCSVDSGGIALAAFVSVLLFLLDDANPGRGRAFSA